MLQALKKAILSETPFQGLNRSHLKLDKNYLLYYGDVFGADEGLELPSSTVSKAAIRETPSIAASTASTPPGGEKKESPKTMGTCDDPDGISVQSAGGSVSALGSSKPSDAEKGK